MWVNFRLESNIKLVPELLVSRRGCYHGSIVSPSEVNYVQHYYHNYEVLHSETECPHM